MTAPGFADYCLLIQLFSVFKVNGEIYNHKELREKLKSHQFRTGSDCEVITHLVSALVLERVLLVLEIILPVAIYICTMLCLYNLLAIAH